MTQSSSTTCSYCKAEARYLFKVNDRNRRISDELFRYHRCTACGLIFLRPIPIDLGAFYPTNYYPVPATLADLQSASTNEQFKLDLITGFVQKGKLLEVGPAFGNFAYLAKRSGFDVDAIEMDSRCCEFLRTIAGITTFQSNDAAQEVKDKGPYDVIALWHVIEHLPNFHETLDALAARVKHGGILVVAAPNPAAWQFTILGRYWTHVDAPRHVVLIPVELLVTHMSKLGFTAVFKTMTDTGGVGWNRFGWQVSLANFVQSGKLKWLLERAGSILTRIMKPFERNDCRGSAYTIIFRKDA